MTFTHILPVRPLLGALAVAAALHAMPVMAASATLATVAAAGEARLVEGAELGRDALRARAAGDPATARQLAALIARVQPYVDRHANEPAWITSRLQMYWQGRHTQVYVKNSVYDHADGQAPAPTVRFTGARDTATAYATPKLEDVKPYMGENDLLWLQNRNAAGQPWEWAPQAKTGRIVEAINLRIAELGREAAFLYWYTGDEAYARFAYAIFDTYMTGIAYREMPVDLGQGHDQTLLGLQSYEVIHEDIVGPLTESADFMRPYLQRQAAAKRALYDTAFKKWADVIITNGVPWNNWNLIQARFVLQIAAGLDSDARYADGHGKEYYLRSVVDGGGARQWSLKRLLDYGYDPKTGIWNESPGYSINVIGDFVECLDMLDRVFGVDLLPRMPVLERAVSALPQYLLPNGRTVGFGDTRYETVRTAAIERLRAYAERHGQREPAARYARLLGALRAPDEPQAAAATGVHALLKAEAPPAVQQAAQQAGARVQDYQSPTFYAPNASWLVQRNGYEGAGALDNALVISQVGSAGNHAHANGIAMELFAKGLSLAPESGRGSGYLQNDHLEYYSQFAAHNTVVVDGLSAYPSMKSNHPLTLQAVYPDPSSAASAAFPFVTFSDMRFIEPETDAEQTRVLGTVRLDPRHAYVVDIFRSHRRDKKDRYHDYIYHNLGQAMAFSNAAGAALATAPSARLSFADGDLIGYDYWQHRTSLKSEQPLKASFALKLPTRAVTMNAWLQGSAKREFFSLQAPPSTAWSTGMLPAGIDKLPLQTLVIRQTGEAWSDPFSAIFEAASDDAPGAVQGVEKLASAPGGAVLRVTTTGARRQTIVSHDSEGGAYAGDGVRVTGRYGIVAERDGQFDFLFLGQGAEIAGHGYAIIGSEPVTAAALWQADGQWMYAGDRATRLCVPAALWPADISVRIGATMLRIPGRRETMGGKAMLVYDMPSLAATRIR